MKNRVKIASLLIVWALALSCGVVRKNPQPQQRIPSELFSSYIYTEAVKRELMGDTPTAVKLFNEVIKKDTLHAPSYFELASIYMGSDPKKAVQYITKAVEADSSNLWYASLMGRLMVVTGDYDSAFDVYSRLVEDAPRNPDNYRMLAALYQQRRQPFTAIAVLDSAENKLGMIEELADMKRELLVDVSLFDKAISESRAMVARYPWNDRNHRILGSLYLQTGKDSLGLESLKEAYRLDPESIDNLSALNNYYRGHNDIPNFFATCKQIMGSDQMDLGDKIAMIKDLKMNRKVYSENFYYIKELVGALMIKYPTDQRVVELYGQSLLDEGGAELALPFYKNQVRKGTAPIEMYNMVLDIETYLEHPDSLNYYAQLALERFPRNTDLYIRQGGALTYMKRPEEALKCYQMALKYAASDSVRSVALGIIGDHYHTEGELKRCYSYYEKALKKDPSNAMVLNNFSYYLSTDGEQGSQLERAVEMGRRATEIEKGNATYLDTYAWALYKNGQLAEAKKVMQQAISLDTSDSNVLLVHYGDILYAMGDKFMATIYWKKAKDKGYDPEEIDEKIKKAEGK